MNDVKKNEIAQQVENTEKEKGASLVEYALLVALIAVICIFALQFLGQKVSESFSQVGSAIGGS